MQILSNVPTPITTQDELKAALLSRIPKEQRGVFFAPPHPKNLTPELHGLDINALQAGKKRILKAIENQEQVLIFGDYDCDGVTATAVLWETLNELGLQARPFLPHREKHGYGLSVVALEEVWSEFQPDLVVTVDNGIVAHEAFAWLKDKEVGTILTDHHSSDGQLPDADIILHSTKLAGVTVAWMLAHTLAPDIASRKLDYAVLGTLADQVPLYGANRSFAYHGLTALRSTSRPSLLALASATSIDLSEATTETIHYSLAPRINAMGRLGDAMDALRALVSRNPERIQHHIQTLQETNASRQDLTRDLYEEVLTDLEHENEHIVVVHGEFHEGIIGLLASKIVDHTHKPAIVISTLADSVAKASVRSIPGVNIIEFLRGLENIPFLALGGHAMAAGFSVPSEEIKQVTAALQSAARNTIVAEQLIPSLSVVGQLDWNLLTSETLQTIDQFAPFGAGNENPLFLLNEVSIRDFRAVGKSKEHWLLNIEHLPTARSIQAIHFRAAQKMTESLDTYGAVVVQLKPSNYRNRELDIVVQAALPR